MSSRPNDSKNKKTGTRQKSEGTAKSGTKRTVPKNVTADKGSGRKTPQTKRGETSAKTRAGSSRKEKYEQEELDLELETKEKRVLTKEEQSVRNEIILTVTALVSVLLTLTFFGLGGPVGEFINRVLFGVMGALGFIFPLLLFFFVAFALSNHGNKVASHKMLAGIAFLFLFTALLQMIFGLPEGMKILDYYKHCADTKSGGGVLGALIAVPFTRAFDTVATYCIIIAFMIIFLIILTGKAIFEMVTRAGKEKYKRTRDLIKAKSEYYDIEQQEFEDDRRRGIQIVTLDEMNEGVPEPEEKEDKTFIEKIMDLGSNLHGGKNEKHRDPEDYSDITNNPHIHFAEDLELKNKGRKLENEIPAEQEKAPAEKSDAFKKAADTFPKFTIKGNVEEDPVPAPTDMFEMTPERKGTVRTPSEQAEFAGTDIRERVETNKVPDASADVPPHQIEKKREESDPKLNAETAAQIDASLSSQAELKAKYVFPPVTLLNEAKSKNGAVSKKEIEKNAETLTSTLESFGVHVKLLNVSCGPTVTRYELSPEQGVKVASITKLENDIKLNLAASDIRIEAPIPGKAAIGIEVPNKENSTVSIRELIESPEFKKQASGITFAVGKDISGDCIVTDISKMPHLLIAGATGSGKSVCINTLIMSILYKYKPEDIRLIMIDPKMVELGVYNGIPHLLIPVVTDPKKAAASLNWAVLEMTNRYQKFAEAHVRDLKGYNAYVEAEKKKPQNKALLEEDPKKFDKMPQVVIIVDELADLMMVAPGEVENSIIRLSQLARAAGMHLVIATQRPSVNVITGLIKANMPSRIALAVTSSIDSRTILDQGGAEKLLGKGDMLFSPMNLPKPVRVQGAFVSDGEVERVVEFIKDENAVAEYSEEVSSTINSMNISGGKSVSQSAQPDGQEASGTDEDEYLFEAARLIIEKQKASIGMLQRVYRIGFNRAARIVDTLTDMGVLGPENGTKSREILMTKEQFDEFASNYKK